MCTEEETAAQDLYVFDTALTEIEYTSEAMISPDKQDLDLLAPFGAVTVAFDKDVAAVQEGKSYLVKLVVEEVDDAGR